MLITNYAIYDVDGLKNKIQEGIKETKTVDLGRLIKEEIKDKSPFLGKSKKISKKIT